MKKILALLFALLLCLGSVSAFAEGITVSEEGVYPIVDEKITLDIWCFQRPTCKDLWTNTQTTWYEEKTNVHVNWIIVPQEEVTTKLNLSVASGEYPDIYFTNFSTAQVTSLASGGVIIPLNDLIEEHGYYTKQYMEASPDYVEAVTTPDGNIYTLWGDDIGLHMQAQEKMFVNATWYEAYKEATGKEVVTTEDFRDMLIYFRDNDMNGNGDATDEIPLVGSTDGWSANPLWFLMNPFQLVAATNNMLYVSEDGTINAPYITDGWREGLKYINSLYEDGLIAEESFVQDSTQLMALASKATPEEMVVGTTPNCWQGGFCDNSVTQNVEYALIHPLEAPDGTRQTAVRAATLSLGCAITSQCEYPEVAMKWLDYWMSLEGAMINSKGWEGVNYYWDDEKISALGTYPSIVELDRGSVGDIQNDFWYGTFCFRDSVERRYSCMAEPGSAVELLMTAADEYIENWGVKTNWPAITWGTDEQLNTISLLEPTITDYVKASAVNFILGNLDIENDGDWEMYLEDLNAMGLEDYLAVQYEIINGAAA